MSLSGVDGALSMWMSSIVMQIVSWKFSLSVLVIGILCVTLLRVHELSNRSLDLSSDLWGKYTKILSENSGGCSTSELGSIGDKQTKDLSRMYYIPAKYDGAHNFIFHNSGRPVDIDYLVVKHPYKEKEGKNFLDRLPADLQEEVVKHRKAQMENTNYSWSGYQDCPFFPRRLAMEYQTISETGWYHKMYQIMVATAGSAIKKGYPITAREIAELCRQA